MRRFLRSFIKWLDARFPEKTVITQSAYEGWVSKLSEFDKKLNALERKIELQSTLLGLVDKKSAGMPLQR